MLKTLIIGENALEPTSWERFDVEDVCAFLKDRYGDSFPSTGRVYHEDVSQDNDVTPIDEGGITRLSELEGIIYVVVYPGEVVTAIIAIVAIIAVTAAAFLLAPTLPSDLSRNDNQSSANNELSNRQNKPRINGRIPDIFGTVRSVPDLIAVPYKVFINHQEVEYAYMCVGRGEYEIDEDTVMDDTTPLADIAGTSVSVYGPNTSPNSGDTPQLQIGSAISEPVYNVARSEAVNGQILRPADDNNFNGNNNIKFVSPDEIVTTNNNVDFTNEFYPGDDLIVEDGTTDGLDLSGTYTVLAVASASIVLANPVAVNADWGSIAALPGGETGTTSAKLYTNADKWIGPFTIDTAGTDVIVTNFVAIGGLYSDTGDNKYALDVDIEVEVTPVDSAGTPTGAAITDSITVEGSKHNKATKAATLRTVVGGDAIHSVRARRTTDKYSGGGVGVDEVKWRDVYAMGEVAATDFGNITTVQTVTYATSGALTIKSRKLSMEVTRKVNLRSGAGFEAGLTASKDVADILCFAALDPLIGARSISELDLDNIYDTSAEIAAYFGTELAAEFSYTFDNGNMSFEETAAAMANSVHSIAYRRGNVIRLSFEQEVDDSTLLFNHRNKTPGSETRSVRFGPSNDYDGVELEWVDPEDDAIVTMYVPADGSASNAKKVETIGIRSKAQAHFLAQRVWGKLQHQNVATEFTATQEADMLVLGDRILVADNTRTGTIDGDVTGYMGLAVSVSQPFEGTGAHTIFLQHYDGSVESMAVTATANLYVVTLSQAPRLALVSDYDMYARTVYQIVKDDDTPREHAFLVTEKSPIDNFTHSVVGVNYDARYYANDKDYIDGIIDIDGNIL